MGLKRNSRKRRKIECGISEVKEKRACQNRRSGQLNQMQLSMQEKN